MGIRIHKVIGYALTDIKSNKTDGKITDSRINPICGFLGGNECRGVKGFVKFIQDQKNIRKDPRINSFLETVIKNEPEKVAPNLESCVIYKQEMGMPEVLCIIPPSTYSDWWRCDNIIDYALAGYENKVSGITTDIKILDKGIWPWEGFINKSTGDSINDSFYSVYNRFVDGFDKGAYVGVEKNKAKQALEKISRKMGFVGYKDAKLNIGVKIPMEVVLLCEYLRLFNDPMTAYRLKPVIYTYWG